MKLCRDCKYNIQKSSHLEPGAFDRCSYPFNISPVTGAIKVDSQYCGHMRKYGPCDLDGRYFEPKVVPTGSTRYDNLGIVIDHDPLETRPQKSLVTKVLEYFK